MKTRPAKLWKDRNPLFDYLLWRGFEEVGGLFLSPFTTAFCGSTLTPPSFPLFTATSIFLDPIPPSCDIVWAPQQLCKWSMSKTNNTRRALVLWKLMTMFFNKRNGSLEQCRFSLGFASSYSVMSYNIDFVF